MFSDLVAGQVESSTVFVSSQSQACLRCHAETWPVEVKARIVTDHMPRPFIVQMPEENHFLSGR